MQLSLFTVLVLIASLWSVAAVPAAKPDAELEDGGDSADLDFNQCYTDC
ncbi:hypothetical protein EW026_g5675 [Hermanssonia centrifuga]|uniref:Uncharacterized protein n=1 Tax=Hermanssonia centrifuga TaxID=98765 RepID=A0A4S4KDN8_9APHY|nr:hypothetical protein EW026_g5675 [Hermanssonia centrifuga]